MGKMRTVMRVHPPGKHLDSIVRLAPGNVSLSLAKVSRRQEVWTVMTMKNLETLAAWPEPLLHELLNLGDGEPGESTCHPR